MTWGVPATGQIHGPSVLGNDKFIGSKWLDEIGIKYNHLENKFVQPNKSDDIKIKYQMDR
ncbi:MAG: hypothetical protein AAGC45_07960 [Bacteroidota bacterium]